MVESLERGEGEYTKNGSVDLKGNPVLRSKRGGWTACLFVVVYELVERMAYYGIASNLVLYLTDKLHQGTVTAANNVTNWVGTVFLTPILGAYVADAHLGRYWTFVTGSAIYLVFQPLPKKIWSKWWPFWLPGLWIPFMVALGLLKPCSPALLTIVLFGPILLLTCRVVTFWISTKEESDGV